MSSLLNHSGSQKENVYFIRGCLTLIRLKTHLFSVDGSFKLIANATHIMIINYPQVFKKYLFSTVLTFKTLVFLLFQLFETPSCFTSRRLTKQIKILSIEKPRVYYQNLVCVNPKYSLITYQTKEQRDTYI